MKKRFVILLSLLALTANMIAQDFLEQYLNQSILESIVIFRQDYQVVDEDDEAVNNQEGQLFFNRIYTIGVRIGETDYLVNRDFAKPWLRDNVASNDTYHPVISASAIQKMGENKFRPFGTDVESATEEVENHLYLISESKKEGFQKDCYYGNKCGYAVWVKSSTPFNSVTTPTDIHVEISKLEVTTREKPRLFDIPTQPEGYVIGGFFLIPSMEHPGEIKLRVNGLFEMKGDLWKLVSLGTEQLEIDDEEEEEE